MAPLQAILFDLDGTLVDSARDLMTALNVVLAQEKLSAVDIAQTKAMIGDGALKLIERGLAATGGDPARGKTLMPAFLSFYEMHATAETRAYPGVRETLSVLRQSLKIAVVTNKPEAAARLVLDALSLTPLIDTVIGGDTVEHRKPHPLPVQAALSRLGVAPACAAMVGDNHHDVEAARAAGVRAVVVSYGYSHRPPGLLGADVLIDRMADLPAALAKWLAWQPGANLNQSRPPP